MLHGTLHELLLLNDELDELVDYEAQQAEIEVDDEVVEVETDE